MTAPETIAFPVSRRGYDRGEVDRTLTSLRSDLASAATARDAALAEKLALSRQLDANNAEIRAAQAASHETRAEIEALRAQVADLSTIPSTVDGMSERLQQMVRIAQDEVNDMRTRATTSAAHVLALAQAEADELGERSGLERREFEAERRSAEEALRAQLEESRGRLDQLREESEGQKARLSAELAEQRVRVEQEFASEMDGRRAALLDDLAALEARHRREADLITEAATQDARSKIGEARAEAQRIRADARGDVEAAHRELAGLRTLQHQVAEQLTAVRALLDWTLPQMDGPPGRSQAPGAAPSPALGSGRPADQPQGAAGESAAGDAQGAVVTGADPAARSADEIGEAATVDAAPEHRPTIARHALAGEPTGPNAQPG